MTLFDTLNAILVLLCLAILATGGLVGLVWALAECAVVWLFLRATRGGWGH
jgi:hypothetical protein